MAILIFIALFCLLGWFALSTLRVFRRDNVGTVWWIFLGSFLLAGIAAGFWAGFKLEYPVSPTLRFLGFPFPMAVFHLESGTWIDYVHEQSIMIFIGMADAMVITFCSVIPVSVAFYVYRFLRKQRLEVRN